MARILVVDDERAITETLKRVLALDGHVVTSVCDPARVPSMDLDRYDLLILDVMMPGLDGFELLRAIRSRVDVPVLFLTARIAEKDAVLGLGLGADDYLRKPFGVDELRAKVAAHLRRERRHHVSALAFDAGGTELRVLLASKQIEAGGQVVPLTATEYEICEFLARRPGQVFSRSQLREHVLGWESAAGDDAISMHVSRARRKLAAAGVDPIETVWKVGYKWQL